MDDKTSSANTSFMQVDTELGKVCLAGQVQETDSLSSIAATVTFSYSSNGDITKVTDDKVQADFVSVDLTLDISGTDVIPYNQTITQQCKVIKATLQKAGARDKVKLHCDLGENFAAFPDLNSQYITNINEAYAHQKRAKANSKNGKLKISHVGEPTDEVPISCSVSD